MSRKYLPRRREGLAVLLSAGLFAFAFPPFDLVFPVFLFLIPVALLVTEYADGNFTTWDAARTGFWFGLLGYGCNLYWIAVALAHFTNLAILGYIASLIWLAPVIAFTFATLFVARRRTGWPLAILLPVVWTAFELLLNYLGDLSFPWLPLGLSMAHHPLPLQSADISGVRGVSFWIAMVAGLISDMWLLRSNRSKLLQRLALALLLVASVTSYGYWRLRTIKLTPLAKASVIQPNIPEEDKMKDRDPTRHIGTVGAATRSVGTGSDIVILPETAFPNFLWRYPDWKDSLRTMVSAVKSPILFGVFDSNWPSNDRLRYWNAAMVTNSAGDITNEHPYHKEFLVPIVERVPFINPDWFEGLRYFGSFGKGGNPTPFNLPFGKVGVLICYESAFPQLSRYYKRNGVKLLTNITNDAWFGHSSAPYQHFAHLPVRAVENRLPVVRSANTGISSYIDPLGRVRDATHIFVPATRTYNVETTTTTSLYTKLGDWLGLLCAMFVLAILIQMALFRKPSRQ